MPLMRRTASPVPLGARLPYARRLALMAHSTAAMAG